MRLHMILVCNLTVQYSSVNPEDDNVMSQSPNAGHIALMPSDQASDSS